MYDQSRLRFGVQFFLASMLLFSGLISFQSAQTYNGLENNFMADNWSIPLAFLLTILFALGWWFASVIEKLVLTKGRNAAIFALYAILFLFASTLLGSFLFTDRGFLQSAIHSSGYFLVCGLFFHLAVVRPEVITKLQQRR